MQILHTRCRMPLLGLSILRLPLLALLVLGGCVNDAPVQPEAANLHWDRVPFPGQHRVRDIAVDPAERIFLAVYDYERDNSLEVGIVYFSGDNGASWERRVLGVREMRFLGVDSEGRIYATTWEEVYRSVDHGERWERRLLPGGADWLIPEFDASDNVYLHTYDKGIYFSSDHGDSWTQIGAGIQPKGELKSLAVSSAGCLFGIAGNKLYRSCDRGASWNEPPNIPWGSYLDQVAIDGEDRIFIPFEDKLYRSEDGGETWTELIPLEDRWVRDVWIDGQDRIFRQTGAAAYMSNDHGESWTHLADFQHPVRGVASNPAGDLFFIGDWGLGRSIDGGASWEMLGFTECAPIGIVIAEDGTHYVGMSCGGIYRAGGDLERWENFNTGLSDITLHCFVGGSDSTLIAGAQKGAYVTPADRPAWSLDWLSDKPVINVLPLSDDSILVRTYRDLLLSSDGGVGWSSIGMGSYEVTALMRGESGRLYVGANFGGVFGYTGEGIVWDQLNEGLGDLRVNALATSAGGVVFAGTDTGIFVSSNGGASWRRFSPEQIPVVTILAVGEDIFVGSGAGVFWTRAAWGALMPQNDGLPSRDLISIHAIAADPDGRLFLWIGNDFYRSSQSVKDLVPAGR